jgi:hypothetical protein
MLTHFGHGLMMTDGKPSGGGGGVNTFDPATLAAGGVLSSGNLTITKTSGVTPGAFGIISRSSGKYYWEYSFGDGITSGSLAGIATGSATYSALSSPGFGGIFVQGGGNIWSDGTLVAALGNMDGRIAGVAIDFTAQKAWFRADGGNWNNDGTANPATGVGGLSFSALGAVPMFPVAVLNVNGDAVRVNFGALPFRDAAPSGFSSDTVAAIGSRVYWQVNVSASQAGGNIAIAELQFRAAAGVSVTESGGTALFSTQEPTTYQATKAYDGSAATIWSADNHIPAWLGYQKASAAGVAEVMIQAWNDATFWNLAPKDFVVRYGDDGKTWLAAKVVTGEVWSGASQVKTFSVP